MKKMFLLLGMLAISFLGFAQVSRQQAINSVLNSVVSNNVDSVNVYMEPLSQSDSYYKLSRYDSSLANKCDERLENYDEAIAWYEEILTNPNTSFNDSIFAAIDLGDLYLRLNEGGGKTIGKYGQFKPKSVLEYEKRTEYALSLLPRNTIEEHINLIELSPISNLEISVGSNDTVILNWDIPTDATDAVISWSDMIEYDEVGVAAGQCATDQAVRFDKNDLTDFIGWKVTNVSLILSYDENGVQDQHYYVRIWKGEENASEQVYEKEIIDPEFAVPLTVSVDSVVCIEEEKELRIGYHIDKYMMFPWVIDNVPVASEGKGFNYRLYHKDSNNDCELDYPWDNSWPYPNGNLCVSATIARNGSKRGDRTIANQLTGYRIYRDGQLIKEIPYSFVTYFTDTEFTKETDVEYCVTAVYGEEESEPVCATANITGVVEKPENDGITVSPNPTNGLVRIEGVEVAEMQVYNALGQLVKFAQNSNEINLRDLPQGVYSLRITGDKGEITSKKIVVE